MAFHKNAYPVNTVIKAAGNAMNGKMLPRQQVPLGDLIDPAITLLEVLDMKPAGEQIVIAKSRMTMDQGDCAPTPARRHRLKTTGQPTEDGA